MKRFLSLTLMVLFIAWPFYTQAKTIGVDPDEDCSCCSDPNDCYTSIQTAIFYAQSGDDIVVCPGEYKENILFPCKNITVRSSDPNDPEIVAATVINGGSKASVVNFSNCGEGNNVVFSGFTLTNGVSGIYCLSASPQITHCRIINNSQGVEGGGIYCRNGSPTISHCTINDNSAGTLGGGIYSTSTTPTSPVIEYCTISNNTGGGIYCDANSNPQITHCTIEGNKANSNGSYGGIYCSDTSPAITYCSIQGNSGNGIYCDSNSPSSATFADCNITGNDGHGIVLSGESTPEISNCSINSNKGIGVSCNSVSPATIDTCKINGNESYGIHCVTAPLTINYCTVQKNGKEGIYLKNFDYYINHCTVTGNMKKGIYCLGSSSLSVLDSDISKNKENGIYAESSTPIINRCSILENEKSGIYCNASEPEIVQCRIIANKSDQGGGIYCTNCVSQETSTYIIMDCTISENSVTGNGGGICLYRSSFKIDNCNIQKNRAQSGGGILIDNGRSWSNDYQIDINRCSLIENLASSQGGGIYCQSDPTSVTNCLILKNKAPYGGGISSYNRTITITNCTIAENQGEPYGGIYINWYSPQIKNCILWNNLPREISGNPAVTYSDIRGGHSGEGNINTDPLFVDSEIGNYYLRSDSPCIDKAYPKCLCEGDPNCTEPGDPNDVLPFDRDGISRPQGCAVDMGAYEYSDPNSCTPRASFTAEPMAGFAPLEVEFDASSSGGSLYENPNDPNYPVFKWDFGDGNIGEGKEVVHTYTDYGTFDVRLTVITDCNSHSLTLSDCIKVKTIPTTRHVGEGQDYQSIQEAIDDAEDGELIRVHDGTYREHINFKGKRIRIQSENGAQKTIIDGGGNGRPVTFNNFEDEHSVLEGFTLQNGSASDGGGIYCYYSSPTITRCIIRKNSASYYGGGIYFYGSSASITNCIIHENRGGYDGGITCRYSSPFIINNTIVKNIGRDQGGIACYDYSYPIIKNCILWDNLPNEIYGSPSATYSDIRGGYSGEENINNDPLFIDSESGNYYLNPNSPCIDSGDAANAPLVDIEGIQRDPNEKIDIGAYEYVNTSSCTPRASFTADETAGHYPLTVSFDASSSGGSEYPGGAEYYWDFGDGNTATTFDVTIEHIYDNPNDFNDPNNDPYGSYNVSLTISTDCGSHALHLYDFIKIKSINPTREVGTEGGYQYSSIQEAIDDSRNGEFILVHDGIYYENLNFKGKRITVRSENGPLAASIDGDKEGSVVIFNKCEDRYSELEGFTIQNGSSNSGGGIHCWGSSPHIINCRLMGNHGSSQGGGIYCYASSATIDHCTVAENTCNTGGGIYCYYSTLLIDHSDVSGNEKTGLFLQNSSGTINSSTINANRNSGIDCRSSSPEIINCIIAKNIDDMAGGIYCNSSSPRIINCTIADNETGYGAGGIYCQSYSSPVITNSILWNPRSPMEIYKDYWSNPVVTFSDVRGCYPGEGNICADPLFVADWTGFYYLKGESFCIDAGDPEIETPVVDIDDIKRPLGETIDMGAYEVVSTSECIAKPCFTITQSPNDPRTYTFYAYLCSGGAFCDNVEFTWDFGDGNSAQGFQVEHTYTDPGYYDVSLTETINGQPGDPSGEPSVMTLKLPHYIFIEPDPIIDDIIQVCKEGDCNFSSIQDAIDSAEDGALILVHDGTYQENINFKGKSITLYSANGPDHTTIDGGGTGTVVTFNSGEDMYSIMDGFTIQNGNSSNSGGIYCYFSSPSISNCIIRDNRNDNGNGGGVYCFCSSPGFTNCTITGNRSISNGGGIFFDYSFSPNIINCVITKNMARDYGGGIYFLNSFDPYITHCTIADNKAGSSSGGIYYNNYPPVIINSIIWNNSPQGISNCQNADISYSITQDGCPGEGNINTNPLFVAPEIGNYNLRGESRCIDSGINILSFDREDIPRPQGVTGDMGAYEYVYWTSPIPKASFEATPFKGESPLTVIFDAQSSGGWLYQNPNDPNYPVILWDFGDGNTIEGSYIDCILIDHTYSAYGFYDVSLTIETGPYSSSTMKLKDCVKVKAKNPTREVGEGYDYTSIQKAIDDAGNGEYILLHDGTYSENIDFKGKGITLRSENGPETTIIRGTTSSSVPVNFINGEDDFSVLEGFTVQNYPGRNSYKIFCRFSSPFIKNCIIKGNSTCCAETGYSYYSGIYCDYMSSPQVINCLIIGNRNSYGGGIACYRNSSPIITNCTISNNYADNYGGAIYADNSNPIIKNSILWGNQSRNYPSYNEIFSNRTLTITCSDIQGIPEAYTDPKLCNIDADPLFVNPCGCDYRLRFDSPCIDSNCCCSDITCCIGAHDDIEGKIRPLLIRTECNGEGYDMGAYEYGISLMPCCLESNDTSECISFGFGNEADNVVCESQSPILSFIDPNDHNDPPTPYCTYLKEFQQDPNINVYEWGLKLDLEAITDSNSNIVLTWEPNKLIEKAEWKWRLWQGGKLVIDDMTEVNEYKINKEDGEYLSIVFEHPKPIYQDYYLNSGWNLVSIPINTTDPSRSNLFESAMAVYYYDANEQIYIYVEEEELMKPCIGYWVLVREQVTERIWGTSQNDIVDSYATLDSPEGLRLEKNWNMIGSLYGYTALNLSQGYIKAVYEYDANNNEYREPPEFDTNTGMYLVSGKGYWILPSEECYLDGNYVSELPARERIRMLFRPRYRETASNDNWSAKITAFGQNIQDCTSKGRITIGISDTPLQIPSPPTPPCTTVKLNLINPPSDYPKYIKDIRSTGEETIKWVLSIESSDSNYPLLQWEIPSGLDRVVLELRNGETETGDILVEDMRTTTSYQMKQEDENNLTIVLDTVSTCYRDADNDTYGDANDSKRADQAGVCPEGYVEDKTDCDDSETNSHPGAIEICDGKDNDCDGQVDKDLSQGCSNACGESGTETCVDGKWVNCSAPSEPPEICDGKDNDCDGEIDEEGATDCTTYYRDMDQDGYGVDGDTLCLCAPEDPYDVTLGGDCDDNDPSIYPRLVSVVNAEGYPGETDVAVSITIDDAAGFNGGDIRLSYDPNILTAREVIAAPLIQDFLTASYIIEAEGRIVIAIANSTALESGSGTMVEIIFDVSEEAVIGTKVPLIFEKVILNDASVEPYCSLGINGEFRIVERGHKGDLNQDGEISSADAIITLKIAVGEIVPSDYQKWAGDVNNDGEINAADAILILKAAVTMETIFYLAPDYGLSGETVKIIGWNFGETQGDSVLYFGDTPAEPVSWMDHEIVTTVPPDIPEGTVDVYLINTYGDESNSREFMVGTAHQRLRSSNVRYSAPENLKTVRIPDGIIATPRSQVNIPVETDDPADIAGMDLDLRFDPEVLTPVKVEHTALTNDFLLNFNDSEDGRIRVSLARATGILEGSGALINVTFEVASTAQAHDSTGIIIRKAKFFDDEANSIEATICQDGEVLIEDENPREPEPTPVTPLYSPYIGQLPYYSYNPYFDNYPYENNFAQQWDWMTMFGTSPSGNGYNNQLRNGYHYPSGNGNGYYYPSGNGYNHTYQGYQQYLNPAFYWMQNTYEYNQLPNWSYWAAYPDVSSYIRW